MITRRAKPGAFEIYEIYPGISAFRILNQQNFCNTEEWWAVKEWLEFHELDPCLIPIDSFVYRNEKTHTITTTYYEIEDIEDGNGITKYIYKKVFQDGEWQVPTFVKQEKGEAGPLPWPDILGPPRPVG